MTPKMPGVRRRMKAWCEKMKKPPITRYISVLGGGLEEIELYFSGVTRVFGETFFT